MLYFPKWKVTLILAACFAGVMLTLPNLFSPQTVERWPGFLPKKQVSLGLDLRGGSYLLYEVDMRSVLTERLNRLVDELRNEFRTAQDRLYRPHRRGRPGRLHAARAGAPRGGAPASSRRSTPIST